MRARRHALAIAAIVAAMALLGVAGTAQAVFPNFSGCVARNIDTEACIDIQNRAGTRINIKGFDVPLGESLEIRGELRENRAGGYVFVPPTGTNGFFAVPVRVPGGIFGIEWLPGNEVLALTELAGPASSIRIDLRTLSVRLPIKVRLVNVLLGMDCHIGTTSNPVNLNLIVGTTSPPAPNRPITGRVGTIEAAGSVFTYRGNVNVENSFAVPGATECGLGLGLINSLVNLRLRLPSAAGNNSAQVNNDVAFGL